jgi:hypothetical protein
MRHMTSPRLRTIPEDLVGERYCVVTTAGRVTGRRHAAQLWFVPAEGGIYLYSGSGGLVTWCLNLQAEEEAVVTIGTRSWLARAVFVPPGDSRRDEAFEKFLDGYGEPERGADGKWPKAPALAHLVFIRELD